MKNQGKSDVLNLSTISDLLDYMTPDELLALMQESKASLHEQYQEMLETEDLAAKSKIAHSIKGESGMIGASKIHFAFKDFEATLNREDVPGTEHPAYSFEQLFDEFHSAIITFINHGK